MSSVLIVEPNNVLAAELAHSLKDGGFQSDIAPTVKAAQQNLSCEHPVVLVLSELIGFEGLTFLLRSARARHVPTIVLGIERSAKNTMTALDLGADCFMAKPYSLREILARVRSLTRS
ncbi:MAG: response regulator [Candidatus Eremiobacteraeota bacterium]|nr:response regulator [Candidatus Eremiobacteraeota bacterium]